VPAAERVLAGKAITEAIAVEAANAALAGARPMSGNKYKIQIAKTAVRRAILAASRG
jgi:xanthine dehydrogenase YagS FAD-binding subunit